MVELLAGPAEELDGGPGKAVGKLEDLFNVTLGDTEDAGVLKGLLDREGVGGSDDLAEELDFGREVGDV